MSEWVKLTKQKHPKIGQKCWVCLKDKSIKEDEWAVTYSSNNKRLFVGI